MLNLVHCTWHHFLGLSSLKFSLFAFPQIGHLTLKQHLYSLWKVRKWKSDLGFLRMYSRILWLVWGMFPTVTSRLDEILIDLLFFIFWAEWSLWRWILAHKLNAFSCCCWTQQFLRRFLSVAKIFPCFYGEKKVVI